MSRPDPSTRRQHFRALHESGTFVMPNPWDAGTARYLEWRGFDAVATTSAGFAATLGRGDQEVTLTHLVDHVAAIAAAVDVPVSVDAERCFADDPDGVAATVAALAEVGAAGVSIEDYDPARGAIDPVDGAAVRVAAAVDEAARHGMVVTARAENHLYGIDDLDDTVGRLRAYAEAGADVVYAPGVVDRVGIERLVAETGRPVNVLAIGSCPPLAELATLGVRRVSTGATLAWAAYAGLASAVDEIVDNGSWGFVASGLPGRVRADVFRPHPEPS